MISIAKVSMASVKQFEEKAAEIRDCSQYFANGKECIDDLQSFIASSASSLRGTVAAMQGVRGRVAATMRQCETEIGWLTNKLNELRQKGANEGEIHAAEAELQKWRDRLEKSKAIDNQLSAHAETINQAIKSLDEKESTCRQLKAELEILGSKNMQLGTRACSGLKKVEEAVSYYLQIKCKRIR